MSGVEKAKLLIRIGKKYFGIPATELVEAAELLRWTPIPQAQEGIVGAAALHDGIVALIDYENEPPARPYVLFLSDGDAVFGLLVDEFGALVGIPRGEPPEEIRELVLKLDALLHSYLTGDSEAAKSEEKPPVYEELTVEKIISKFKLRPRTIETLPLPPPGA